MRKNQENIINKVDGIRNQNIVKGAIPTQKKSWVLMLFISLIIVIFASYMYFLYYINSEITNEKYVEIVSSMAFTPKTPEVDDFFQSIMLDDKITNSEYGILMGLLDVVNTAHQEKISRQHEIESQRFTEDLMKSFEETGEAVRKYHESKNQLASAPDKTQ